MSFGTVLAVVLAGAACGANGVDPGPDATGVDGNAIDASEGPEDAGDSPPPGPCLAGATTSRACGNCGTRSSTCDADGRWSRYGSCTSEGACAPGATQEFACPCERATRTRTCASSCEWDALGPCAPADPDPPAFPGAEGFGARALGGRGGEVIRVWRADDANEEGTLRWALARPYPRTVVFAVSGYVDLTAPLVVTGAARSCLTVAGQTAPGDGVIVRGNTVHFGRPVGWCDRECAGMPCGRCMPAPDLHDVVIRFLRIRRGRARGESRTDERDALALNSASNVIVDHCSASWGTDENISITSHPVTYGVYTGEGDAHDITVQWSIAAEGLDSHSKGIMVGYGATRVTLHHNFVMSCEDRMPYVGAEGQRPHTLDVVNNVIYNYRRLAGHNYSYLDPSAPLTASQRNDRGRINWVGNFCRIGPSTVRDPLPAPCLYLGAQTQVYYSGNFGPVQRDDGEGMGGNWNIVVWRSGDRSTLRSLTRFDAPIVTTQAYDVAAERVLEGAGATLPVRDEVDTRLVREYRTGEGSIPADVPGWPPLRPGSLPDDLDGDGMPDDWERARGLDPSDSIDSSRILDGSGGYTAIELYLNELAARAR